MLLAKDECFYIEWRLMNATRIEIEPGYETLEAARAAKEKIKQSYPVAYALIGKCKKQGY